MRTNIIGQVEDYVKSVTADEVAHDFKHADRVRNWAVQIARGEGYQDIETVEIAALLHDIGLPFVKKRSDHGKKGAEVAGQFLRNNKSVTEEKIVEITGAISCHSRKRKSKEGLPDILGDADTLDALGVVGIMRAMMSKHYKPDYDAGNIKGKNWGLSTEEYDELFKTGLQEGDTIIDQINLQIHYYRNLKTETAKRIGRSLVEYMKNFIKQLESEIESGRKTES